MKTNIKNALWIYLFLVFGTHVKFTIGENDKTMSEIKNIDLNRAVLIFLNDSERDNATAAAKKIGAISIAFSLALVQQAGPIIVSASILDNMRQRENPAETNFSGLMERFNTLRSKFNELNNIEIMELKNIYRYLLPFNQGTLDLFIIKKISADLHLMIPKKYLHTLNIDEKEVELYTDASALTNTELLFGMRVNHMQTVTDINSIKKPLPTPPFAHYFMDALHNTEHSIFITNNEYYAYNNKNIPLWSIYITGHGTMGGKIAALSIDQFKDFLTFLEQRIHTKLLYYLSCYAAGTNHETLYKDIKNGIDKTYPFAIITQAITDASISLPDITLTTEDGNPIILYAHRYRRFVELVMTSEIINYKALADYFQTFFGDVGSMLPQIKLPGLSWFSSIHEDRVCSIGSVLARTRTKPLNVETFFARQGKKAAPVGILLYATVIPFELIINSKTESDMPPTLISMIPGDAVHHIKQLSSSAHTIEKLITSFFQIKDLDAKKIFIIDELAGPGGPMHVYNVVIELTPEKNTVYYMQDAILHKDISAQITDADAARYKELIGLVQHPKKIPSKETIPQAITSPQKSPMLRATPTTLPVRQIRKRGYQRRTKYKKMQDRCVRKFSR